MTTKSLLLPGTLMILSITQLGLIGCANEPATSKTATTITETMPPIHSTDMDIEERRQEALENIQAALDEDPEEAAKILGSTPIDNLDLKSLETLGNEAFQFVQQKMFEQQQDQQEERARLRDLQDLQNARR